MKRDKFNGKQAEECTQLDWGQFANEVEIGDQPNKRKDEFDWDFKNVKTDWSVEFDEKGRQISSETGRINVPKSDDNVQNIEDRIGANIVSETLTQIAAEDEYKADGAFVTGEIDAAAVNREADKIDEEAIRRSVDDKIVIKSAEVKAKRESREGKQVKIRVKKEKKPSEKKNNPAKSKAKNKYKNIGTIPNEQPPKEASAFRKQSANWRYDNVKKADVTDEDIENTLQDESIIDKIKRLTPVQYVCIAMALIMLVGSVMATVTYANYQGEQNKANALAKLPQFVDIDTDVYGSNYVEEEYETQEAAADVEAEQHGMLSLVLTSVEKDLKIKLVDDEDTLVKDIPWGVTVTDSEGEESIYEDDDEDGIIHISDISAGDYTVAIIPSESLAGYTFPTIGQEVSVKAKIEYKVIANIKDEIKKESEVNVALEDPNGGKGADVETGTALTDTVTWVESTETSQGEEYEEAEVDLSRTENIIAFVDRLKTAIIKASESARKIVLKDYVLASSVVGGDNTIESEVDTPQNPSDNNEEQPSDDSDKPAESADDKPVDSQQTEIEVKGAKINKTTATMVVGDKMTLSITYEPAGAKPKLVTWLSSDESVATVSNDGNVVARKEGKAQVGAWVNNLFVVYCDVTVNKEKSEETKVDSSVVLSGPSTLVANGTATIEATCSSSDDYIVEWKSLDEKLATVIPNGNQATVRAAGAGTVRIQATSLSGVIAYFDINISNEAQYADSAQLYDSSKNKLYVFDNSEYRLAKYSDYKSGNFSKYYRKIADVVYTGWQTIDGLTYYFTENHEKVTGDQVIGGVTYHFGSDGALSQGSGTLGIDVSKYQPSINWSSVKASGVNYVIIRCGYRGASTGALIQDPCFYSHIKGAKDAGLKVGVYFFSTALNEAEAVEEASMCAALCSGYGINYPVFIDVEPSSRPGYNGLSAEARTANIRAFCQTIQSAGYTPGLYANKTWLTEYINTSQLSCKIWLAQYNANGPTYQGHYDLWQYTSKGRVDGISGNVDMNQSYLGY